MRLQNKIVKNADEVNLTLSILSSFKPLYETLQQSQFTRKKSLQVKSFVKDKFVQYLSVSGASLPSPYCRRHLHG